MSKNKKVVYIAGKYSGKTHDARSFSEIDRNIMAARDYAVKIWESGAVPLTPHLNSYHMELDCNVDADTFYRGDLELLSRCDAMFLTPGWEHSNGSRAEKSFAESRWIPIFYELEVLNDWIATDEIR